MRGRWWAAAAAVALVLVVGGGLRAATWEVQIDERLPVDRVWLALEAWSRVADVEWVEGDGPGALKIRLGAIDARQLGLPPGSYAGLYQGSANTITVVDPDPALVSSIVMHEVGHFLGLWVGPLGTPVPHCSDRACLMYRNFEWQRKVCRGCTARVIRRFGPRAAVRAAAERVLSTRRP